MKKVADIEKERQIRILKEFILVTCQEKEDKAAIKNLINNLEHQGTGMTLKRDLARRYGLTLISFNKRVYKTDGLWDELYEKFQYTKHRKYFMPAEVEIFEKYLGTPKIKQ